MNPAPSPVSVVPSVRDPGKFVGAQMPAGIPAHCIARPQPPQSSAYPQLGEAVINGLARELNGFA